MLKPGDTLHGTVGGDVTVGELLGVGGQGAVYRARPADEGGDVAVKWYLPESQRDTLRTAITELVGLGPPSHHFLWPDDVVTRGDEFGYVMRLRPPQFASVPKLLTRKVKVSFPGLVRAAHEVVSGFKALHAKGLHYCDISEGNLFVDVHTGDVLICDNDNVGSSRRVPDVLGTARYMAPEVVRGAAKPSALTDHFSMAVLLFLLLVNEHPLVGATELSIHSFDTAAMNQLYGTSPLFVFDPEDHSNRPDPTVHRNALAFWPIYPERLRKVFTQAFTEGLHDPSRRPTFGEWQAALTASEDTLMTCACGKKNFFDPATDQLVCWSCKADVTPPTRLVVDRGKRVIVLSKHTKLYDRHLSKRGDSRATDEVRAEVVKHPEKEIWGLKNLGPGQWFIDTGDGQARSLAPGLSTTLRPGTTIQFGEVTGVVEI